MKGRCDMIKIGDVVQLTNDIYYGTDLETDHVLITNIHDDKFDGIGITDYGTYRNCKLENWARTYEGIWTKSGHLINISKKYNEDHIYDIYIKDIGYRSCGVDSQLIDIIKGLIDGVNMDVK